MALELSILIATMPNRNEMFHTLRQKLASQAFDCNSIDKIEILSDDSMQYNIGVKRNYLLNRANGKYIVFIDDDDFISDKYIKLVLNACKSDADCIGINGTMTTNGIKLMKWVISIKHGLPWRTENNVYLRTTNHISPVKREYAMMAKFPAIAFGEDAGYSEVLFPFLVTETIITDPLYYYDYKTDKKHGE